MDEKEASGDFDEEEGETTNLGSEDEVVREVKLDLALALICRDRGCRDSG